MIDRSRVIQLTILWFVVAIYQQTSSKTLGVVDVLKTILPLDLILSGISFILLLTIPLYLLSEIWASLYDG
jgi:hypothetical protein